MFYIGKGDVKARARVGAPPKTVTSCATIRPGCYRVSGAVKYNSGFRSDFCNLGVGR
jgi:hypothetical protein